MDATASVSFAARSLQEKLIKDARLLGKEKNPTGFCDEFNKAASQFNRQNVKWDSRRRWGRGGDVPWI